MTMQVYYNLKKLLKNNVYLLWTEQKSNSTGNSIAQTQDADSHVTLDQVSVNEGNDSRSSNRCC